MSRAPSSTQDGAKIHSTLFRERPDGVVLLHTLPLLYTSLGEHITKNISKNIFDHSSLSIIH